MYRNIASRLYEIEALIEQTELPQAAAYRQEILDRLVRVIKEEHGDPVRIYPRLIATDWPAFAALELTTKEGVPFLYARWQSELDRLDETFNDILLMNARQTGKSTGAGSTYLKRMMRRPNRRVLHIAPTEKQLEVRDTLRHFIQNSEFIQNEFVKPEQGGYVQVEEIQFAENNSHFEAINLSIQASKGDTKRGKNGTDVGIDEVQMVDAETQTAAIDPMLSSAHAGVVRRLIRFGTFSYKYRPDFDQVVDDAKRDPEVGYLNVTCWDAMDDGIRRPDGPHGMRKRFEKLNIPCIYVRKTGACPRALPHWYADAAGVKRPVELGKIQPGEFKCDLVCFDNDTFVAEDLAQAPKLGDRFFAKDRLLRCARPYRFWTPDQFMKPHGPLLAAVDIGKLEDQSEIVIGELFDEADANGLSMSKLRIVSSITVEPYNPDTDGPMASWRKLAREMRRIRSFTKCSNWMIDITAHEDLLTHLYEDDSRKYEYPPFEPQEIWTEKEGPAEKNGLQGLWLSGPLKSSVFENHRRTIAESRYVVPAMEFEPKFWDKFFEQHLSVRVRKASRAQYTVFEDTPHLADACAYLSYLMQVGSEAPAAMGFNFIRRK